MLLGDPEWVCLTSSGLDLVTCKMGFVGTGNREGDCETFAQTAELNNVLFTLLAVGETEAWILSLALCITSSGSFLIFLPQSKLTCLLPPVTRPLLNNHFVCIW